MNDIPWDDNIFADREPALPSDRPAWLPLVGDGVGPSTAVRILAAYRPALLAELERCAATIRQRRRTAPELTIRSWAADEIVTHWSRNLDAVLVGFVGVDDRPRGGSFYSVLILIDKQSGGLVVRDPSGLLDREMLATGARA